MPKGRNPARRKVRRASSSITEDAPPAVEPVVDPDQKRLDALAEKYYARDQIRRLRLYGEILLRETDLDELRHYDEPNARGELERVLADLAKAEKALEKNDAAAAFLAGAKSGSTLQRIGHLLGDLRHDVDSWRRRRRLLQDQAPRAAKARAQKIRATRQAEVLNAARFKRKNGEPLVASELAKQHGYSTRQVQRILGRHPGIRQP
jgi:hypothetical protein